MKVLLLKKISGLGKDGDTVEVADGHARNLLFPKHLAVPATDAAVADVEARAAAERREAERELQRLQRLADALDGLELVVRARATEEGTLYGSVGATEIIAALASQGNTVDPTWVRLEKPFVELGEFAVKFELPHGLEAEVRVIVEREDQ